MATRPAYLIQNEQVIRKDFAFTWVSGLSASQKRKCALSLHDAIRNTDPAANVLEVSTKSNVPLGVSMSAFNLKLDGYPLECIFQSSKTFPESGPHPELLTLPPKMAKQQIRLIQEASGGILTGFRYQGIDFPLDPKTLFYDYIYIKAIQETLPIDQIAQIAQYDYFTDIEFNPDKSINTQAKTAAEIRLMLMLYGEIPEMSMEQFLFFHRNNVLA